MPETTVDLDHRPILGEYQVGFAREVFPMKAISKAFVEETFADYEFGLTVDRFDPGHHLLAFLRGDHVSQCGYPFCFAAFRTATTCLAISVTTGTDTEFPNCR